MPHLLRLFASRALRYLRWGLGSLAPGPDRHARATPRRLAVMACFLPAFGLLQLTHWLAFLLDEILFPGYREVEVREPLFVLGMPRSGTTHLHRVLAEDPAHTTFSTWECLLAPSIVQRRAILALASLDRRLGGFGRRGLGWLERRVFGALDDVHGMSLDAAEEDYLALLPILGAFILVLPFPDAPSLWRLARFDRSVPDAERAAILGFYRACLQKHLYVHGRDKRILSKNAAFGSWARSLRETFPDARFVGCLREPREALPSQLSAIAPGMRLFDNDPRGTIFQGRMTEMMVASCEQILDSLPQWPRDRQVLVGLPQLTGDLEATVRRIYARFGLPLGPGFAGRLGQLDAEAKAYRSSHRYQLTDFGSSGEAVDRRFAAAHARYDFAACRLREPLPAAATTGPAPRSRPEPVPAPAAP